MKKLIPSSVMVAIAAVTLLATPVYAVPVTPPLVAVPEPSTYGLFAIVGLICLVAVRRFKRKH